MLTFLETVQRNCVLFCKGTYRQSAQLGDMAEAPERFAQVAGQAAHVGALAAADLDLIQLVDTAEEAVAAAEELMAQVTDMRLTLDALVVASGSGGTHAGLLAGLTGTSSGVPVIGISTRAAKEQQEAKILELARRTAELAGSHHQIESSDVTVLDEYVGAGYSLPTDAMVEAVTLFARLEGVLLDPVYTGKAAAGLIDQVRQGAFDDAATVVFLHTGGAAALYAYQSELLG